MWNNLESVINEDMLLLMIRFGAVFALILGIGGLIKAKKQIDYFTALILLAVAVFQMIDAYSLRMVSILWLRKIRFRILVGTLFFDEYHRKTPVLRSFPFWY
uniref:Uncharacterized protein n=1 Tax=Leptospira ellisii TaxID=2023197 RepID=A0A2N0B3C5_9LEPT|nr:hypothetical protein [Leptospira ellisii]PJZ91036.1 hypothetical protein CH379_20935 [Leptospira ellisii]